MTARFTARDFGKAGKVVRKSAVYTVTDVTALDNLVVSKTELHPGKETGGHSHAGADEVYSFVSGSGEMEIDSERFPVKGGDIVLIKRGSFHKVFNTKASGPDLVFVCVFEKYGDRK